MYIGQKKKLFIVNYHYNYLYFLCVMPCFYAAETQAFPNMGSIKYILSYLIILNSPFLRQYLKAAPALQKHQHPESSADACAVPTLARRRWWLVSVRGCVALRQHQYQLRRAYKTKYPEDGAEIRAVFAATTAPELRRWGTRR